MRCMVAVVMMAVSPGPPIAPVGGVASIIGLSIHHRWLHHDRGVFDDHGRGVDIHGRRGLNIDGRRRGDEHRHGQPEPQGDMHPSRVRGAREGQGRKTADTHDATRP